MATLICLPSIVMVLHCEQTGMGFRNGGHAAYL
jgi:hypothetical protein